MKNNYTRYILIAMVMGIVIGIMMSGFQTISAASIGYYEEPILVSDGFFETFKDHAFWSLEYKRYSSSGWSDGNSFLTIEKTWIPEDYVWKFNLIIDNPLNESLYSARFIFSVDLSVLDYVENVGENNYILNYSGYSAVFDWNDLIGIPNLEFSHGVYENSFYFIFKRDNIPALYHGEFDPWFGNNLLGLTDANIMNTTRGSPFVFVSNCSSCCCGYTTFLDNITMYINVYGSAVASVRTGIYNNATNVLIAGSDYINGTFVDGWYTFNFTHNSSVQLYNGTEYLLVGWCNNTQDTVMMRYHTTMSNQTETYADFGTSNLPNPFVNDAHTHNRTFSIYANYTCYCNESQQEPTNTTEVDCDYVGLCPNTVIFIIWVFLVYLVFYHKDYFVILFASCFQSIIGFALFNSEVGGFILWILLVFGIFALGLSRILRRVL